MVQATVISIKLTPTEYQTLMDALETYNDVMRCKFNKDYSDLHVKMSISSIPTQCDRVENLLRIVGPD